MKNKFKIVVGIIMMAQAVASFITFIVLACKKKKLWAAFLAIATAGSAGGAYLLFDGLSDEMNENKLIDDYDDDMLDVSDEDAEPDETGETEGSGDNAEK